MLSERQHCKVLQYSTLPLLVPAYFHALENAVVRKLLLLIGLCTCVASWLHWGCQRQVAVYHNADIALSSSYILIEALTRPSNLYAVLLYRMLSVACYFAACKSPVGTVEGLIAHLMFRHMACINVLSLYLDPVGLICWSVLHVCTVWGVLDLRGFLEFIKTVGGGRHRENIHSLYNC